MRTRFFAAVLAALPLAATAQNNKGELWEITMSVPGMPAGMVPPQRSCQGDDPERAAKQDPNKRDCKVTDSKKTATRTTVTLSCKDGSTMVIDQQYNAARTEFKSTMTTKGGKHGDMTMSMTGRKVGTCDAVAERKARDEKMDNLKKQAAAGQAQAAAVVKQSSDDQIRQCNAALEKMDWHGFGMHGKCYKKTDGECAQYKQMYTSFPEVAKACNTNIADYCKRFQTADGFMKVQARSREEMAKTCGVTIDSIKAAQCPRVAKNQSPLAFLGAYCPVEAKPLAQEQCAGRDYTSKMDGKYAQFCQAYLANNEFERKGAQPKSAAEKTSDQVQQGVSKGIDKIKGLFGR